MCFLLYQPLFSYVSDGSMTTNMKSKTFWREYDDITEASGVKLVAMGAKGDYIILG